jgi:hypothetical protein
MPIPLSSAATDTPVPMFHALLPIQACMLYGSRGSIDHCSMPYSLIAPESASLLPCISVMLFETIMSSPFKLMSSSIA